MCMELKFSSTYHPQADDHSEQTIMTLNDMLRASNLEFKGSWKKHLPPLIKFAYTNNFQASIQMTPYKTLYGRKCISHLYWNTVDVLRWSW